MGAALRYEGTFEELDLALGAGYTNVDREISNVGLDDMTVWNVGADFDWGPFGLGMSYMENDNGVQNRGDTQIFVVGLDYHTGPYRFGASYYDRSDEINAGTHTVGGDLDTSRWTGGVVYEYGPGMTFRGSVAFVESETSVAGDDERDGYQVTVGTQINF
jgi:predicted porin